MGGALVNATGAAAFLRDETGTHFEGRRRAPCEYTLYCEHCTRTVLVHSVVMKMCLYGLYAVSGDNSQSRRGKEPMQRLESLHTYTGTLRPPATVHVGCVLPSSQQHLARPTERRPAPVGRVNKYCTPRCGEGRGPTFVFSNMHHPL